MEDWQLDFEWLQVRHKVQEAMGQSTLPDLQIILLLIGIQEANILRTSYTKEEKQDLMHVATCHVLSLFDFYEYVGKDDDGWPHYIVKEQLPALKAGEQSVLMKEAIVNYFIETEFIE